MENMSMHEDYLVAVLLPVYKGDSPDWFQESIDSIKAQDCRNLRIYLGIDGDLSKELELVILNNADHFYRIIRNKTNEGLASTLNNLIRQLDNEDFVFRMDSDDVCLPDRFYKQIDFLVSNPKVDIVGGALVEVYEDGSVGQVRCYPICNDAALKSIHMATPVAHPTVCFRGTSLVKIGFYNPRMKKCEDIDLWFSCLKRGLVFANLPDVLLKFRCSNKTLTNRSFSKAKEEFVVYIKGVYSLFGVSPKMVFPIMRLTTRLLPVRVVRRLYKSRIRNVIRLNRNV